MTRYSVTFCVWARFASQMRSSELVLPNLSRPQFRTDSGVHMPHVPHEGKGQISHMGLYVLGISCILMLFVLTWQVPTFFDEAGHRVATQYLFAVLHGQMSVDRRISFSNACSVSAAIDKCVLTTLWFKKLFQSICHVWNQVSNRHVVRVGVIVFYLAILGRSWEHSRTLS